VAGTSKYGVAAKSKVNRVTGKPSGTQFLQTKKPKAPSGLGSRQGLTFHY
jgi:hypothetical protein